jgi:hypothetical protein
MLICPSALPEPGVFSGKISSLLRFHQLSTTESAQKCTFCNGLLRYGFNLYSHVYPELYIRLKQVDLSDVFLRHNDELGVFPPIDVTRLRRSEAKARLV